MLWVVVTGRMSAIEVSQLQRYGYDTRRFDDTYWYIEQDIDDPMNEYRELMRNDLAESQLHARHRANALRSALNYRLSSRYAA